MTGEDPAAPTEPSPQGGSCTDRLPLRGGAVLRRSGSGSLASRLWDGGAPDRGSRGSAWRGVSCVSTAWRPVRASVLLLLGGRPWSQGRWDPKEQVLLASAVNQLRGRARGTGWASCPHSPPPSSSESLFNQQVQRLLQGGYKAVAWLSPGGGVEAWSETPASSREPGGPGSSPQHSRQHELNQVTYARRRGGWDLR